MEIRQIENRLMECPDVREVCVVASRAPSEKARIHAFVVLSKDTPAVREHFHAHCNVRLKKSSMTVDLRVLERLPRTRLGAVSRGALAALAQATG